MNTMGGMWQTLAVAVGGALGAVTRYQATGWIQALVGLSFPWGTLAVNLVGSFIIGLTMELAQTRFVISAEWRLFITTGFCGGLTTFSTYALETLRLAQQGQTAAALGNTALNVGLTLVAAFLGIVLARIL